MTKRDTLRLLALFYGGVLAVILVIDTFFLACDALGRATGAITTQTFGLSTAGTVSGIEEIEGAPYSVNEDPQLILEPEGRAVIVRMEVDYGMDPGEVMLFYAKKGEDFSKTKCVYPRRVSEGVYEFLLPSFGIEVIRLDPASRGGVRMDNLTVTVNAPRSVWSYYAMTNGEAFNYVVYTGLAAAAAGWCWINFGDELLRRWRAPLERAMHLKKRGNT